MKAEIILGKGIELENIVISFGEEKTAVVDKLQDAVVKGDSIYAFNKDLRIDTEDGVVSYIEITGGKDGSINPVIGGMFAFDESVKKVIDFLKSKNDNKMIDDDGGYSFYFKNLGITVTREQNDDEIDEMREELEECGINPDEDDDFKYEKLLAEYFCAVGMERISNEKV